MSDAASDEEIAVYQRLARDAGVAFKRLAVQHGVRHLDALDPALSRDLFRQAWRAAVADYFQGQDITELNVEIDRVIDHLIAAVPLPIITVSDLN